MKTGAFFILFLYTQYMSENNRLPRWDLSPIYPSVDSAEFEKDLDRIVELSKELERASSDKSRSLYDCIQILDEIGALVSNTGSYTYANLSTDTSNSSFIQALSKVEDAEIVYSNASTAFLSEIKNRTKEFSDPRLRDYAFILEEMLELSKHQMSAEEEALASDMLRVSASAWSRLQEAVTSSIEEGDKTLIELRGLSSDPERSVRKDAFEREIRILKDHEVALAYALNGVKGTTLLLEKRRGWSSPLERSAFTSRISMKALDALISTLEDAIPTFRAYLGTKARLLGLDKLDWFDIVAPVAKSHKRYEFSDAKDIIVSCYSSFSKEMGDFVRKAFEDNWIDAEPRKGKVGGAYDTSFKKSKVSRVLSNYDHTYESVSTLAHELGHAYHDSVVKDLPATLSEYPMTLAETASIFGETVVFTEILKTLDKDEKLPIIEQFVSSACQTCLDILSRFYFERSVFEKRKTGELTAEEMCSLMLDAQEKTYGDAVRVKHPYMWAVKGHYYSEGFSFYNYPYAFGQLFALALFKKSGEDENFPASYKALLEKTGMMDCQKVASLAGLDIEKKEFWAEGMSVIFSYIKELESWL